MGGRDGNVGASHGKCVKGMEGCDCGREGVNEGGMGGLGSNDRAASTTIMFRCLSDLSLDGSGIG